MRSRVCRRLALPVILSALVVAAFAQPAAAAVEPYGANDAGGFRSVLPPGENGLDTISQIFQFKGFGTLPPHYADQQPLYENLVYGSPGLTEADVPNYFKDATFGVPPGEVESTIEPRPGTTIVRDKAYGIPHIYGDTRADTMFGAGYAGAQDRLFLMDVLRHTGRAELASFLGGSNAGADASQWAFAPYTEADFEKQIAQMPRQYGAPGQQAVDDLVAYVEGINAYVAAAKADPQNLQPAEYSLLGQPMESWKPTDIIAIASLVGGIFGRGGGNELSSALTMESFVERMGKKAGRKAWRGFREKNDPEAPTTIERKFPYETGNAFAKKGLALPNPKSVREVKTAKASSAAGGGAEGLSSLGARLKAAIDAAGHASNWELVSAKHSTNGHPIAVMGPQVGYYVPQILMEEDLHGPGIDARGASFAGVNLVRPARPRPRLRMERDQRRLRQHRHVRRGPLQGQLPLHVPRQVPADGKAAEDRELVAERDRLDQGRLADADRLPHRPRADLRPRQGRRQEGRLRQPAEHLLPRGRLGDRVRAAERTGRRHRRLRLQKGRLEHQLHLQLGLRGLRRTSPTRCPAPTRSGRRAPRPTSRCSAPASTTGRASSRAPRRRSTCPSPSTRSRPTRPTSSPGTTSRRRNGRRPTTTTTTGRCTARR